MSAAELKAAIERLRLVLKDGHCILPPMIIGDDAAALSLVLTELSRLTAAAPDLLAALEPFSKLAGEYFAANRNKGDLLPNGLTVGDYFNARAAYVKAVKP